jgi:nitroreductase
MDVREALYTTRAMRRVKPDPIPEEVQQRIMDAAIRAPSGGNSQAWKFMLVDDPAVKAKLGPLYRDCMEVLWSSIYKPQLDAARANPELPASKTFDKMFKSADHLAQNFEGYPLLFFAFNQGDPTGGSIFPAVWNAMLAARAEGVGSAITSVLLFKKDEMFDVLGIPADKGWNFACMVTMGYPTGRWGVAPRRPVHEVAYRNQWGEPLGFEIPEPLWSPKG